MAGPVRQPIDIKNLDKYIQDHVPEIATPLDVKQVCPRPSIHSCYSNPITRQVRLRSIKPYIPTHLTPSSSRVRVRAREALRPAEETTRQASLQNSTPGRARVPHPACPPRYRRPRSTGARPLRRRGRDRDSVLYHGVPRRARLYGSWDAGG